MNFFEYGNPAGGAGFQCVELANRFLWVADGILPISGSGLDGHNYVDTEAALGRVPAADVVKNSAAAGHPYLPGDVVSFSGFGGAGHVAVVTGSTYSSGDGGNYQVTLMEEDASPTGAATANVVGWAMQRPVTSTGRTESVTPDDFLELATPWSIEPSADPGGAANGGLTGVACPSTTSCFAAGPAPAQAALMGHWDGTKWSALPNPSPANNAGVELEGIACPAANKCLAVGFWLPNGGHYTAYAEDWNGSKWAIMPIPNPAQSTQTFLFGISCVSTANCFAVGSKVTNQYHTLIEHWNGSTWSIMPSPTPGPIYGELELYGIACPSSASCLTVGSYEYQSVGFNTVPFAERWNGSSWSLVPVSNPSGTPVNAELKAVACTSNSDCDAVGYNQWPNENTLAEHWNGSAWAVVPSPTPAGKSAGLTGIACVSADTCDAVGTASTSTKGATLVERWDGASWTSVSSPNVAGRQASELLAVACPGPITTCQAVGGSSPAQALAESGGP